jgi:hypothetical protein
LSIVLQRVLRFLSAHPRSLHVAVAIFLIGLCIYEFSGMIAHDYVDIPHHNRMIIQWLHGEPDVLIYSLYFHAILGLTFFSDNYAVITVASVVILTVAVLLKWRFTERILKSELSATLSGSAIPLLGETGLSLIALGALSLLLLQNLVFKTGIWMVMGYIPVNSWHNSTTILLYPFALILFYRSYQFLTGEKKKLRDLLILFLLCLLNLWIKPSYFFVFALAFPLMYLLQHGLTRRTVMDGIMVALATFVLILQYKLVFAGDSSAVVIAPLAAWRLWSDQIVLSLLCSIAFPLLFLIFYFPRAIHDLMLKYAWLGFVIAIGIFLLLAETGTRKFHFNFLWQTIIANFILFLATFISYFKVLSEKNRLDAKDRAVLIVFLVHVVVGMIYLAKSPRIGPL